MCGIALSIGKENNDPFIRQSILDMAHRGPDGNGYWSDSFIALGHTRLAIQDLSDAGHQPMVSVSGRYIITFNGEIYNQYELRKRFLPDYKFKGHSDTETILVLFEKIGAAMLQHMVGMWAFAIWDNQQKTAFISRDRFGQKPLYWTQANENLLFASELKPILKATGKTEMNRLAVSEYLALGNYEHLGKDTFYKHIFSFPPGHYAIVDYRESSFTSLPYWKLEEIPYRERIPFGHEQEKQFRDLVIQAVESQLLSDVPIGTTLSGGLDSSIITSCIAMLGKSRFPVFSAQFPDSKKYDETGYVEALKRKWGNALDVIYTPVKQLDLASSLEQVLIEQEEPFGDPSIMAHGFLVRAAKEAGVPVLLGGQGGDEVSMGYPWMYHRLISYAINNGDWSPLINLVKFDGEKKVAWTRMVLSGLIPGLEFKLRLRSRQGRKKKILNPDWRLPSPAFAFGKVDKFTDIYKESLYSVGLPHLCHYDDRSTMAKSIEGRMPFLDHRLFEFASCLQVNAFYRHGFSKYLFRKAFADHLPEVILNRKDKIGFYTPLQGMIEKNKAWIAEKFRSHLTSNLMNPTYRKELEKSLASGKLNIRDAKNVFRLLSVIQWQNNAITNL